MLLAFLIYNDGIQTIIKMATAYGTELGIGAVRPHRGDPDRAVRRSSVRLPVRHARAPKIGAKRSVFLGLLAYTRHQHARLLHDNGDALLHPRRRWWAWCRAARRR